jgi:hypothetical protein
MRAVVVLLVALAAAGCSFWGDTSNEETIAELGRRYPGQVFYLGDSFAGLPLTEAAAGDEVGPDQTASFIYGDCEVDPGFDPGGCALPLDVQNVICPDGRTAVGIFANDPAVGKRAVESLRPIGGPAKAQPKVILDSGPRCGPA